MQPRSCAAHPRQGANIVFAGEFAPGNQRPREMRKAKRAIKIVFGFTLLVLGALMMFTPRPGWATIFAGLAVLAAEYLWARRLLARLKVHATRLRDSIRPAVTVDKA